MRPRNDKEREIVSLSGKLAPISEYTKRYLIRHAYKPVIYKGRTKHWCSECGTPIKGNDAVNGYVCPVCGKRLCVDKYEMKSCHFDDKKYAQVLSVNGGYQLIRTFIICKHTGWRVNPTYDFHEVAQDWISADGSRKVMARTRNVLSGYCDSFILDSDIEIKDTRNFQYNFSPWAVRVLGVLPVIKRNGFDGTHEIRTSKLLVSLIKDRISEILIKNRQYMMLEYHIDNHNVDRYEKELRICIRHKYVIENPNMWVDTIRMMSELGMDTHNPKFICPENLTSMHDDVLRKYDRHLEKEREKRDLERLAEREESYMKMHNAYFGLCFTDGEITISTLQSVADIYDEAKHMHHCVFASEYDQRPDSLIMSARDNDGNRIETIEVNTCMMKLMQSQGPCNKDTKYHERIISLVNSHMDDIARCALIAV